MKRFNNGTVTVIVFKEHIVNITLSDPAGPSKAPQDYKDFIPEDSILQNTKEEQDEKGSYKTEKYIYANGVCEAPFLFAKAGKVFVRLFLASGACRFLFIG